VALAVLAATAPAAPASVGRAGYDISFPLCGSTLPAGGAFGIVGVNGGLANNPNPCLAGELAWAALTPGLGGAQPAVSVYVNTADPGTSVADWPTPATGSETATTPYGVCDGTWTPACGYLYGAVRAAYSYRLLAAAGGVAPASVPWWLDVETLSSWAGPATLPGWAEANIATLQGFVAGLRISGAAGPIGFYSSLAQWLAITGLGPTSGRFPSSLPDWVAGSGTLAYARAHCQDTFTGGAVKLIQYATNGLDGDYACPPPAPPRLRISSHLLSRGALRVTGTIGPAYRGLLSVALSATTGGRPFALRRSVAVAAGRWEVILRLPPRRILRGGLVVVTSSARDGLVAGAVRLPVRLSA
jgi:hypothetical protein